MMIKIGLGLIAVILLFLGYVALQPSHFKVERQITIHAPAEKIFPYLNSSKLAEKWAPWPEVDPQAKMNYSGPDDGVGSKSSWDSQGQLGTGSATIVESVPNERVQIKLEYSKPMVMSQDATYSLRSEGNQSVVSWVVTGQNGFVGRLMCMFMNMDKHVGGMFEKGLSNLKNLVETSN